MFDSWQINFKKFLKPNPEEKNIWLEKLGKSDIRHGAYRLPVEI